MIFIKHISLKYIEYLSYMLSTQYGDKTLIKFVNDFH